MSHITQIQIRYRPLDTDGAWTYLDIPPTQTTVDINGVDPGKSYRVEARSVSSCGAKSYWVAVDHTVNGVPDIPLTPSGLMALEISNGVHLEWAVDTTPPTNVYFEVQVAVETTPNTEPTSGWTSVGRTTALSFSYHLLEDQVQWRWYRVRARNYGGGASVFTNSVRWQAISMKELSNDIAAALLTAQNAQATSDHLIEVYYQTTAPTTHSYGDIWVDTDDHDSEGRNVAYRWTGTQWQATPFGTDAMVDALLEATTANAKADGKVQTFFQSTAPDPLVVGISGVKNPPWKLGIGDLWFNTSSKQLYRWSGTDWSQNIGDVTIEQLGGNGKNILFDEYTRFDDTSLPAMQVNNGTATRDTSQTKFGTASLKLVSTSIDQNVYFGSTWQDIPMDIGTKFIFSMYVRSTKANAVLQAGLFDGSGTWVFGDLTPTGPANTWTRVWMVLDTTPGVSTMDPNSPAARLRIDNDKSTSGVTSWVDGLMLEPMIGNKTTPSPWTPGVAGRRALVAIANAAFAQSTADGKIQTFIQPAAPTATGLGDIWFDSDDGNKIYTWQGSPGSWVATPDSRIAQAIIDAAGAQATADGKITTFYQTTTPTAKAVGDLWFNTNTMVLSRWDGASWASGVGGIDAAGDGDNLLPNSSFTKNTVNAPTNVELLSGQAACDGWTAFPPSTAYVNAGVAYTGTDIRLYNYATTQIAAGATVFSFVQTMRWISVQEGRNYKFDMTTAGNSYNGSVRAGITIQSRITVRWYNAAGTQLAYQAGCSRGRDSGSASGVLTAPAGTVKCVVRAEVFITNNTASPWGIADDGGSVAANVHFTRVSMKLVNNIDDDVEDGTNNVRFGIGDGYFTGGGYRIGLRFGASYQQYGDARNIRRVQNSSYISVRTTTALSADSTGAVDVLAHTVRYGAVSIAYSAVNNAVTGLAQGSTYVIYCVDPGYQGGVQTYHAASDPTVAMNVSQDVVIMGEITIPTSGTSSGGGGSGGPGNWCVDWDTKLPDGRYVRDLQVGDMVECWNLDAENPQIESHPVLSIGFGEEESYRLVTRSGHAITQSKSTPMHLKDGRNVKTLDMLYEDLLCRSGDEMKWARITTMQNVGVRKVVKVNLGDKMFFAGEDSEYTVATHNSTASGGMKP